MGFGCVGMRCPGTIRGAWHDHFLPVGAAMTEKKLKVEIAPGAFDNFEGTQEELQELLAQIHQMAEDGTLFENSTPVSDEEAEAAWQRIEEAAKRQ